MYDIINQFFCGNDDIIHLGKTKINTQMCQTGSRLCLPSGHLCPFRRTNLSDWMGKRMWRDRILEAKKEKGITTKYMADYAQMSEKTVARMLSGANTKKGPFIDNVIMLGASVGLTPREIFSETGLVVGDENLATLQAEVDQLRAERDKLDEENGALRRRVDDLRDELLDTHRYYTIKQKQPE